MSVSGNKNMAAIRKTLFLFLIGSEYKSLNFIDL